VKALENIKLDLNSAIDFKCEKVSVQAAVYPGNGARYVRHKDSYPGGGPQRRITILYYLNPGTSPERFTYTMSHDYAILSKK